MKDVVFYPDASKELLEFVRTRMKQKGIDVLFFGRYASEGQAVTLSMTRMAKEGADKTLQFPLPAGKYEETMDRIILAPGKETSVESYPCSIFVTSKTVRLQKDEKFELIKQEAEGNAFIEMNLKKSDFNLVSPVDVTIRIDDTIAMHGAGREQTVTVSPGIHRALISFRRGYFLNESLVYTSQREVVKQIDLDLHKVTNLSMDINLSPLFEGDAIDLKVVDCVNKVKKVVRPIPRVDSDKTVEVFKD